LKEAAAALPDTYLTDERKDRIAAMSDEDFTAFKAEMAAAFAGIAAPPVKGVSTAGAGGPPRETAMVGAAGGPAGGGAGDVKASTAWIRGTSAFAGRRN
jgi:hypothetical protein